MEIVKTPHGVLREYKWAIKREGEPYPFAWYVTKKEAKRALEALQTV